MPLAVDSRQTAYVGIDPGNRGGVAVLYPDDHAEAWHMPRLTVRKKTNSKLKSGPNKGQRKERTQEKVSPDLPGIYRLFADKVAALRGQGYEVRVLLEDVHARPKDGKKQAFAFGYARACCEMALAALDIKPDLISPSVWRPQLVGTGKPKSASLRLARRLFPDVDLPMAKDEARAEALLLAHYHRVRIQGGSFTRKPVRPKKAISAKKVRRRPDAQDLQDAFDELVKPAAEARLKAAVVVTNQPAGIPQVTSQLTHAQRRDRWRQRTAE